MSASRTGHGISIYEVGPRDGLQNLWYNVDFLDKVKLVDSLIKTGLSRIEVGSFTHPALVPNMSDTGDLYEEISLTVPGHVELATLVPNKKGFERAMEVKVGFVNIYISPSVSFNLDNLGIASVEHVQEHYEAFLRDFPKDRIRVYVSCAFGSRTETHTNDDELLKCIQWGRGIGKHVVLCDTVGVATPSRVTEVCKLALSETANVSVHFHYGSDKSLNMTNNLTAAYLAGVRQFDSSIGGLGGCPFTEGSEANLPTEALVYWAIDRNIPLNDNIDLVKLRETTLFAEELKNRKMTIRDKLTRRAKAVLTALR